jgi:hypothetical protein
MLEATLKNCHTASSVYLQTLLYKTVKLLIVKPLLIDLNCYLYANAILTDTIKTI